MVLGGKVRKERCIRFVTLRGYFIKLVQNLPPLKRSRRVATAEREASLKGKRDAKKRFGMVKEGNGRVGITPLRVQVRLFL